MKNSNKIVFNTGVTYGKAVVTSVISLYATRLILGALGAEDFGLYNVIGGMIALLAFLNAAMTTSTQRYLSVCLGKGSLDSVKKVFANSIIIHLILGVIVVLFVEVFALYFIQNKLNIDPSRLQTAKYILHFTVISTFITIISVPYEAVINAHEDMGFLALVSVFESGMKLVVAWSLLYISGDKLIIFGLLTTLSTLVIRFIKRFYTIKKYEECKISIFKWYDKGEIKELTSFASWNLFGVLCSLGRNQGVAVVLNLFYSTVINAAYGIANQINAQLMFFSQTMMSAMRPQIMKSEGANDRARMIKLSLSANRLSFFLFTFFALPLYFQMPIVLKIWLNNVPQFTTEFCRAILLLTMANQINMGLMTAVQAIGNIKTYQIIAGSIQLLTLPVGFVFLKLGYQPYSIVLVSFFLECISTIFRIFYFQMLTGFSVLLYTRQVLIRCVGAMIPSIIVLYILSFYVASNVTGLVITSIVSITTYASSILLVGIEEDERSVVKNILKKIKMKLT